MTDKNTASKTLIRRIYGLFKLASDRVGTPEGDSARRQMTKMMDKSGVELSDEQLQDHEVTVPTLGDMDGDLAAIIADITNTVAFSLKSDKSVIRFKGVRICVLEAERAFTEASQGMKRMASFASLGHLVGCVGPDRFMEYATAARAGAAKASDALTDTLEQSEQEAEKFNAFDTEPTDQEEMVVVAATRAADELKFWESLRRAS